MFKKKNSVVKFVAPTKIQIVNIVRPIFRKILEDCPSDIKPEFKNKDYIYYFPNGSEIQLAGTDAGHAEKLRGGDSDIWFVDEAGSCDDLNNIVKSILLPTTLITKGKGVLASTPPREPDHDFIKFIEEAEMRGSLIKKTIYDNPRITSDQLKELVDELGGLHTDEARRELLCEIVRDPRISAVPEFTTDLEKELVKPWVRPPFYDAYESMDTGGKDLTVVLLGYYDFRAGKVIIDDEIVMDFAQPGQTIDLLTKNIHDKEIELWTNQLTKELKKPYLRFSDIDYIVTQEISKYSIEKYGKENSIHFLPTKKDDKDTAVNNLRILLGAHKIIINPKCTTLIRHLRNVKWEAKNNRSRFARSVDNGHFDAVDALIYMIRNIIYTKNPYPPTYDLNMTDLHVQNYDNLYKNSAIEAFKKAFAIKPNKTQNHFNPTKRRF